MKSVVSRHIPVIFTCFRRGLIWCFQLVVALLVALAVSPIPAVSYAGCRSHSASSDQLFAEARMIFEQTNGAVQEYIWDLKTQGRVEEYQRVRQLFEDYLSQQTAFRGERKLMGKTGPKRFRTGIDLPGVFKKIRSFNEVLAYWIDKFFELDVVPITVLADFGGLVGKGSVQIFIEAGKLTGRRTDAERFINFLMDNVDNNAGGHLETPQGHKIGVDFGDSLGIGFSPTVNNNPIAEVSLGPQLLTKLKSKSQQDFRQLVEPLVRSSYEEAKQILEHLEQSRPSWHKTAKLRDWVSKNDPLYQTEQMIQRWNELLQMSESQPQ